VGHEFGLDARWEIGTYYSNNVQVAVKGPITPEEQAAWLERAQAARAARLAAQQEAAAARLLSPMDSGGGQLDSYDPNLGFWLLTPQIQNGTNVLLTLTNNDPSIGYDIYFAPALLTNAVWNIVATGIVGQADFTIPMTSSQGFFRSAIGGDWDGDGVPNWMDAAPTDSTIGVLSITIDSPINGATLN
jgi:hypothetical protein